MFFFFNESMGMKPVKCTELCQCYTNDKIYLFNKRQ